MAKKDFKNSSNPALQFISGQEEETPVKTGYRAAQRERESRAYQYASDFEAKTRRVQIVLKPSLYGKAKERAEEDGISFNEYVHRALERAIEEDDL